MLAARIYLEKRFFKKIIIKIVLINNRIIYMKDKSQRLIDNKTHEVRDEKHYK